MMIRVLKRAMVVAAEPTRAHSVFLSCFDLLWHHIRYSRWLIFYESTLTEEDGRSGQEGSNGRAAAVMEKLKSSLALCLVHYYPWCGRIAKGTEPPHRLFIDCSVDAGVEFVEASSPLPLSHLARDGFQMKPLFKQLCQQPHRKGDALFSKPLLSIQATLFSDGGLVLGIANSHIVADGQSFWDFMVSWGECSRGVPLSLPPLHNREMLAVLDPSPHKAATWSLKLQVKEEEVYSDKGSCLIQKDDEHKTSSAEVDSIMNKDKDSRVEVEKDRIAEHKSSMEDKDTGKNNVEASASSGGVTTKPLVSCMFNLPASAIKKLKSEAGGAHTSFEVICAHFWKHFTTARETATGESTFFFPSVNCRTRMTPPLPSSYFGNAITINVILSTVGAIQRETLCATACRVHDAAARIKEDVILGFMHWLETHNNSIADAVSSSISGRKGINTGNSPWFPVYQVDYGWGKPVAVRTVSAPLDGSLLFFGGNPGSMPGDVEICTALPESVLKRLLDDPAFLARTPCTPFENNA